MSAKKSGKGGEMNLSGIYAEQKNITKSVNNIWRKHTEVDCNVCDLYKQQSQPFGKKAKCPNRGRPKVKDNHLHFDVSLNNIFDHLFCEEDIPIDNCHFVGETNREMFSCSICKDIFTRHTVNAGCHYFCSGCLSNLFLSRKTNVVECPVCKLPIEYKKIIATDSYFHATLSGLPVICTTCKMVVPYSEMTSHNCDMCTNVDSVSCEKHTDAVASPVLSTPKPCCSSAQHPAASLASSTDSDTFTSPVPPTPKSSCSLLNVSLNRSLSLHT